MKTYCMIAKIHKNNDLILSCRERSHIAKARLEEYKIYHGNYETLWEGTISHVI